MPRFVKPLFAATVAIAGASCTTAPDVSDTVPDPTGTPVTVGFYSEAQAERGRGTFGFVCSECHDASEFRGEDFEWQWRRRTVWDFYQQVQETMPEDAPGSLAPESYADVIAYILQLNEYAAGGVDLVAGEGPMDTIHLGPGANKTGRSASSGNDGR